MQQLNLAPFFPPLKVYLRQLASVGYHLVIRRNLDWPLRWHAAEGNHFVHMFLFFYPQVLVALSVWFDQPGPWQRLLLVWLTAATVCYVLTRLRPLLFLGESERYLEYAMLPALYLTVEKLWGSPRLWALAIWFGVNTFIVLIAYVVQARKQHRQAIALQRGYEALDDLPEGTVLPLGHWNWPLLANTRHPIVHAFGFDENYVPLAEFRVLRGKFPFPGDLSEVVRRYDVKYIVADRGTVDHYLEHVTDDAGELERLATRVYDDQLVVFATKD